MLKRNQKEKLTGEDNISGMQPVGWTPCQSYNDFVLGDNIEKYLHLSHELEYCHENENEYDGYYFYDAKLSLAFDGNGIIQIIASNEECYWRGVNLIGLPYDNFLTLSGLQPDDEEILYLLVSENRGQNQTVYSFDTLGLMLWVWRKKIVTVQMSNFEES